MSTVHFSPVSRLDEPIGGPDREGVHYTAIMSRRKPVETGACKGAWPG